jgi:hypothetical protein
MPEEHPLQAVEALELILEPECVLLVEELEQIQQLSGRLDYRHWRRLRVVHERRDTSVGIQTEEPLVLLHVGRDVDDGRGPLRAVLGSELLEHDLSGLAIGSVLGDQVEAFGVLDVVGGRGDVELVCHGLLALGVVLKDWKQSSEEEETNREREIHLPHAAPSRHNHHLSAVIEYIIKRGRWVWRGQLLHHRFQFDLSQIAGKAQAQEIHSLSAALVG